MYHIVCVYHHWSILSFSTHIMLSRMRTRMLLIHSPCTHSKNQGNHCHQGFGEWVWKIVVSVYLTHPQNIFGKIIPTIMVAMIRGIIFQGATRIHSVQKNTHVVHKLRCRFGYLDTHLSKVVPEHNRILDRFIQHYELSTKCWGLHHGMEFWWPCCGCWSYNWKNPGDWSTSDLVVPMIRIHKHMNVQFIK